MNKNHISGAENAVAEKAGSLKDTVKGIVEEGHHKVDAIKTRVIEVKDQAIDRGESMLVRVSDMIKAHPIKAVAIAFGTGYLGMRLLRR